MDFTNFNEQTPLNTIYLELYKVANDILDKRLQYFSQSQYPVDVYKLASTYNIKIYEKYIPLSLDTHREILGYLNTYSGKAIYLNTTIGQLTRRYTIAYNLAYYLFQGNNNTNFVHYFTNSILPTDFKEQFCHILASFLLMPIKSVTELMSQYTSEHDSQPTFNSWLNYLGNAMGLPTCYVSTSFENIRTLHAFLSKDHIEFSPRK